MTELAAPAAPGPPSLGSRARASFCGSARSASAARSRSSATCSAISSRRGGGSRAEDYVEGSRSRSSRPGRSPRSSRSTSAGVRAGVARRDARRGRVHPAVVRDGARALGGSTVRVRRARRGCRACSTAIGAAVIAIIGRSACKLMRLDARPRSAALGDLRRERGRHRAGRNPRSSGSSSRAASSALARARGPRRRAPALALVAVAVARDGPARPGVRRRSVAHRVLLRGGGRVRVRQRARDRAVPARRRRERAPLAHGAPVPRRRRGRDDHARPGRHHRRRSSAIWSPDRSERRAAAFGVFLPCYLLRRHPGAATSAASVADPRGQGVRRRA